MENTQSAKNKKAGMQLLLMMIISMLTQFLMLGRASMIAGQFGTMGDIDGYNAVHSIANFLFSFISSGITTVLIPAMIKKEKEEAVDTFITLLYVFGLAAIAFAFIIRRWLLLQFYAGQPGFLETGLQVFLITLLSQFFNTQMGIYAAWYQVTDRYNIPKVITLISNAALLVLMWLNPAYTVYDYAWFVAITTVGNALVQWLICYALGYRMHYRLSWSPEVTSLFRIFLPTVFSAGLYQINLLTDSFISSRLGAGQITILTNANMVVSLVNALLVTNILTFLFPKIVASFHLDMKDQQKQLFSYIYFGEIMMALMLVGFACVGSQAMSILYEHGKFTAENTMQVFICICIYMVGFPINMVRDLFYRFFYAKGNTKATFYNSISASVINFVVSILLSMWIGIYGIIAGTVIAALSSCTMIFIRFTRIYGKHYSLKSFVMENIKIIACSLITVGLILMLQQFFTFNVLVQILVYGVLCVILYFGLLFVCKAKGLKVSFATAGKS